MNIVSFELLKRKEQNLIQKLQKVGYNELNALELVRFYEAQSENFNSVSEHFKNIDEVCVINGLSSLITNNK